MRTRDDSTLFTFRNPGLDFPNVVLFDHSPRLPVDHGPRLPEFTLVNDGRDADTIVSISISNPVNTTIYEDQFADWSFGGDRFGRLI